MEKLRKVLVLMNPKSGVFNSLNTVLSTLDATWDVAGIDLSYQFSKSAEDGRRKVKRAIAQGVDTVLVIGGDGMVNTIGAELVGSTVALGVIPTGSGNGFARHFDIPLNAEKAAKALIEAERYRIDVGTANGRPFFVTCSMAWDATLVRTFEKSPLRGVVPYVLAGVYEFLEYVPQPFTVSIDGQAETLEFDRPLVFTVANLTQYGGGALIAPRACPDDGLLELVVISRRDAPKMISSLPRLFTGTFDQAKPVRTHQFQKLEVQRSLPAPIQVDGELVDAPAQVTVNVLPRALTVLVPRSPSDG